MGLEVAWGNLFREFIGFSVIKTRIIHDGTVGESSKVPDEVIDTL